MRPLFLQLMQGLGDTIYSRPFIKAAVARGEEVWLKTAWPQLFSDLPVHCVSPGNIGLRTQHKNINLAASQGLYERPLRGVRWTPWHYVSRPNMSISAALSHGLPIGEGGDWKLDLPHFGEPPSEVDFPYILFRPGTVRSEWRADNRNPKPEYLAHAVCELSGDYGMVGVADLQTQHEWPVEPIPPTDLSYYHGELELPKLMALVQHAAAIISPVGWAVPAALAARKPLLCIGGGQGAHNSPERLVDPRIDTGKIHFALPDNYCRCKTWTHPCNRTISNFDRHIKEWRDANDL